MQASVGHKVPTETNQNLFKMKLIIVALALVAVVAAAPAPPAEDYPKIVRSEYNVEPDGAFTFSFETENGIIRTETGQLKEVLDDDKKPHYVVVVRGSYTYTNPEGKPETITYVADEGGYRAEGDSIPKDTPVRR